MTRDATFEDMVLDGGRMPIRRITLQETMAMYPRSERLRGARADFVFFDEVAEWGAAAARETILRPPEPGEMAEAARRVVHSRRLFVPVLTGFNLTHPPL